MRAKLRILVIGPTPPPHHGVSIVIENLLKSRLAEEFELVHLDIADRRGIANLGRFDLHNAFLALRHLGRFLFLLAARPPDVVYLCVSQGTMGYLRDCLFLAPAALSRRRLVVHLHGSAFSSFYEGSSALMRGLIRWTLRPVSLAVVLSESLKGAFGGLVPEQKICVVPNGIEPVCAGDRAAGGATVLFLGSLRREKGLFQIARAAKEVVRQRNDVRFVLAGELSSDAAEELHELLGREQLRDHVILTGVVSGDEKVRQLLAADIFLFPPVAPEGQPLAVLEAMSAGLPVIATPQGAIADMIGDGVNGFLVPPGDHLAISRRVLELCDDKELRGRMGAEARSRFLSNYTLEHWAGEMSRVLSEEAGVE